MRETTSDEVRQTSGLPQKRTLRKSNLNPIRHWSENWCPGYLEHALCSSEIHLAAAKSLEIIGHATNCCKRPICFQTRQW